VFRASPWPIGHGDGFLCLAFSFSEHGAAGFRMLTSSGAVLCAYTGFLWTTFSLFRTWRGSFADYGLFGQGDSAHIPVFFAQLSFFQKKVGGFLCLTLCFPNFPRCGRRPLLPLLFPPSLPGAGRAHLSATPNPLTTGLPSDKFNI